MFVGSIKLILVLVKDLVNEYPQHAPIVPNLSNPNISIDVTFPFEAGIRSGLTSVNYIVVPSLWYSGFPVLEILLNVKSFLTKDSRIYNTTIFEGGAEVDHSE